MYKEMLEGLIKIHGEKQAHEIFSMGVTFRKVRSGLPVNVWLDDEAAYVRGGHAKRIKFQTDKGDHPKTDTFATMTISDNPEVIGGHKLSGKVIRQLQDFIIKNKVALEQLADQEIDFIGFLELMR
jgi:hypothetical protein